MSGRATSARAAKPRRRKVLQALLDQHEREHEHTCAASRCFAARRFLRTSRLTRRLSSSICAGTARRSHPWIRFGFGSARPRRRRRRPRAAALVRGLRDVSEDVSVPGLRGEARRPAQGRRGRGNASQRSRTSRFVRSPRTRPRRDARDRDPGGRPCRLGAPAPTPGRRAPRNRRTRERRASSHRGEQTGPSAARPSLWFRRLHTPRLERPSPRLSGGSVPRACCRSCVDRIVEDHSRDFVWRAFQEPQTQHSLEFPSPRTREAPSSDFSLFPVRMRAFG